MFIKYICSEGVCEIYFTFKGVPGSKKCENHTVRFSVTQQHHSHQNGASPVLCYRWHCSGTSAHSARLGKSKILNMIASERSGCVTRRNRMRSTELQRWNQTTLMNGLGYLVYFLPLLLLLIVGLLLGPVQYSKLLTEIALYCTSFKKQEHQKNKLQPHQARF